MKYLYGINFCISEEVRLVFSSFWKSESLGIEEREFKENPKVFDSMKLPAKIPDDGDRYQVNLPWIEERTVEMDVA